MIDPKSVRTTHARAVAGYDPEFNRGLIEVITTAIGEASITTDANAMCLRTGETIGALVAVLSSSLALTPDRSPTALRKAIEAIARQLLQQTNKAVTNPEATAFSARAFRADDVGGHA